MSHQVEGIVVFVIHILAAQHMPSVRLYLNPFSTQDKGSRAVWVDQDPDDHVGQASRNMRSVEKDHTHSSARKEGTPTHPNVMIYSVKGSIMNEC